MGGKKKKKDLENKKENTELRGKNGIDDLDLEKEMATHSSVLAWSIPGTEELGWIQSTGSQRVRSNLVTDQPTSYTYYITSAY